MREKSTRCLIAVLLIWGIIGSTVVAYAAAEKPAPAGSKQGPEIFPQLGHTSSVESVAFSPDGRFALSGGRDNTMRLWDVNIGKEIRSFAGHTSYVYAFAFSPDRRYVLSVDDKLHVWDVQTGKEIRSFTGQANLVGSATFSPDGRFVLLGCRDNILRLLNVKTGKEIRSFTGHTDIVPSVAFSPDGRFALSGSSDKTLRLWDVNTGKEIRSFAEHTAFRSPIAFSPDGMLFLSGCYDKTLQLWDVNTGKKIRSFVGHTNVATSVAFSPDGRLVLSGSWDKTARIWDVNTGKEITQLISFVDGEWITITPKGYFNASANGAKHLNVRVGNNVYGIDQFYNRFYRPELVELALAGKAIKATEDIGALAKRSPAPTVNLIAPTSDVSVNKETITVKVAVKDNGGGIGDILVYRNGVQVSNQTRGVSIKATKKCG